MLNPKATADPLRWGVNRQKCVLRCGEWGAREEATHGGRILIYFLCKNTKSSERIEEYNVAMPNPVHFM